MFRISDQKKLRTKGSKKLKTNKDLLADIQKNTDKEARRGGILLIGGADHGSHALRRAQAVLRLDRQPSYWSHAALVLDWPTLSKARGVEVTLDPQDPAAMVPERNGVTAFDLSRYEDSDRYPNLAFISVDPSKKDTHEDLKDKVVAGALQPNADRQRFPFWDWLAPWGEYMFATLHKPSPIVAGIPWPGAALVEYAYERAGVDLTPGATAPNACPETLWSTALYWHEGLKDRNLKVTVWSRVGDKVCAGRTGMAPNLVDEFADEQES